MMKGKGASVTIGVVNEILIVLETNVDDLVEAQTDADVAVGVVKDEEDVLPVEVVVLIVHVEIVIGLAQDRILPRLDRLLLKENSDLAVYKCNRIMSWGRFSIVNDYSLQHIAFCAGENSLKTS